MATAQGTGEAGGNQLSKSAAGDVLQQLETAVLAHLDDHIDRAVRRVAATLPALGPASTVPLAELRTAVRCTVKTSLSMLTQQREPDQRELHAWEQVGVRGAQLGVPVDEIMQALRVCCTVLWEAVSQAATRLHTPCADRVLQQAPKLWGNFDRMSSLVAQAHDRVGTVRDIEASRSACALVSALRRSAMESDPAEELARSLGFDPQGAFLVGVHGPGAPTPPVWRRACTVDEVDRTIVLVQLSGTAEDGEAELANSLLSAAAIPVGIGIQRTGLAGARQSLADAESAYRAAQALTLPLLSFRADWLTCLSVEHRSQHEVLVADAVVHLRNDVQAHATVSAFLDAEGSLPATATRLGIHPNTVAYRLRQLAERTGVDARTAEGTALARMALTFAAATAAWPALSEAAS